MRLTKENFVTLQDSVSIVCKSCSAFDVCKGGSACFDCTMGKIVGAAKKSIEKILPINIRSAFVTEDFAMVTSK